MSDNSQAEPRMHASIDLYKFTMIQRVPKDSKALKCAVTGTCIMRTLTPILLYGTGTCTGLPRIWIIRLLRTP